MTASGPPHRLRQIVTYMEMTRPPWRGGAPPANKPPHGWAAAVRAQAVPVDLYRELHREVGTPWLWWERLHLSDGDLGKILADPNVEIRLLDVGGEVAGFAELYASAAREIKLDYFGLKPAFIGAGLGRFLLQAALIRAWSRGPARVWLHTCDHDHPGARAFYRRAGFRVYRIDRIFIDDPRLTGLLPIDAAPHIPLAGAAIIGPPGGGG